MKEKILSELRKKYEGRLTVKYMENLAERLASKVTEESQIEGVLNELENSPIKITDIQAEGDRRASELQSKFQEMQATIEQLKKPAEPKKEPKPADNPDLKALQDRIDRMEQEQKMKDIRSKLVERAKEKKIPLFVLDQFSINEDGEIDGVIEKAEAKALEIKQQMINEGFVSEPPKKPTGGAKDEKILNDIKEGSKSIKV